MKFKDSIGMAFRDLKRRKGRTFLTTLGITIGTMLLISMVGLGINFKRVLLENLNSDASSKLISVSNIKNNVDTDETMDLNSENDYNAWMEENSLKIDKTTLGEIRKIEGVESIRAYISDSTNYKYNIADKDYEGSISLLGANLDDPLITDSAISDKRESKKDKSINFIKYGSTLTKGEKGQVLLGENVILDNKIDNPEALIGKTFKVTVDTIGLVKVKPFVKEFKIAGIIDKNFTEASSIVVSDEDLSEVLSFKESSKNYLQEKGYSNISVAAKDIKNVDGIVTKIEDLGYMTTSAQEMAKSINKMLNGISLILSSLGVIVLVVAAIGIINTMIMAIYEKFRSIGVMKAVGASSRDIKNIFLVQSSSIGLIGGVTGVILGFSLIKLGQIFINIYLKSKGYSMTLEFGLPIWLVAASVGFSILLALIAGIYPASRASKLNPVDALQS
ncbi:ABC transporter permease [Clostridium sp. 'White wine YQ']|uniref:ABC transporter permease n=1 Tax=Clostridium sp. 'White wine YQ' TaxID=3027474 RepID=UPI00236570D2|nr:ABC transporter permease [Clostridium sp. 'White wine YQ']MDD7794920.1 FtsX-like permease family protein [Clostridium sp. 'White wine YQ']